MRKCPKCNKNIPMDALLYGGSKKRPIVCPSCKSKFRYDYKNAFLVSGWWSLLYLVYFVYRLISTKGHLNNVDLLGVVIVVGLSLLVRFKFAIIKSVDN